jgi:hypothetical protein
MAGIDESKAAAVGYRLRGGPLVEQAGSIKTLALSEMPQFKQEKLLDDPDIVYLDDAIAKVVKCLQDRTTTSAEAHLQTADQVTAMEDLKADRKRLMECATRVFRHSPELLQFRQGGHQGSSVSALCTDMTRKLAFAREHESELGRVGAGKEFLDRVEVKVRALEASSGAQEAAISNLPNNNRAFCIAKGILYFAIKDIINAARALHSKNPEGAAPYNLKLLYRKAANKGKADPDPVVPAPEPAK